MKRSREPVEDLDSSSRDEEETASEASFDPNDYEPSAKISHWDRSKELDRDDPAMKCFLPPHKEAIAFDSYSEYELHYNQFHTNRCLECSKNLPSEHLLGVHIEECHDPLVKVRREKGEHTYSCFVEGCERKCLTHSKRRLHMIDKHMYPKNFFFGVTRDGIDGRRSLLVESGHRRRRSSTVTKSLDASQRRTTASEGQAGSSPSNQQSPSKSRMGNTDGDETERVHDTDMADLTGAMSALRFVPPSIRFGKGKGRSGFAKS